MKLIDEKGRLFGKINIVDLAVILIIIVITAAAIWKLGGSRVAETATTSSAQVVFTVVIEDVQPDICAYAQSQLHAQLTNSSKLLEAHITDCRTEQSVVTPGHLNLYLTVQATATYSGYAYSLGTQELRVGYSYIVKTSQFELTGQLSNLEVSNG